MFVAIGLMFLGILLGFLLRGRRLAAAFSRCVTPAIMLLLFTLGISVGGNSTLMGALPELGSAAMLLTLCGVGGSFVCVLCIRRFFRQPPEPEALKKSGASSAAGKSCSTHSTHSTHSKHSTHSACSAASGASALAGQDGPHS